MTDCEYYRELCSAQIDGALTRAEKKELEAHLAECPACRDYLEELRQLHSLWREMDIPVPDGLHASIMGAIQAELPIPASEPAAPAAPAHSEKIAVIPPHTRKRKPPVIPALLAAAACVVFVLSGGFGDLIGIQEKSSGSMTAAEAPMMMAAAASDNAEDSYMMDQSVEAAAGGAEAAPESEIKARATESAASASSESKAVTGTHGAVKLPESVINDRLAEGEYAAVYVLNLNGQKLPVIDGAVILSESSGARAFTLPNDTSVIEELIHTLGTIGGTLDTVQNDALHTDPKAPTVLCIIAE